MTPAQSIAAIEHPVRRADAVQLDQIMRTVSGFEPKMFGRIIGYGQYHYRYASGREGDSLATGFQAQKTKLSLYIMPGYANFGPLLDRLGKYKKGKACLYINKLADVDTDVLAQIIRAGLDDLATHWEIQPT